MRKNINKQFLRDFYKKYIDSKKRLVYTNHVN